MSAFATPKLADILDERRKRTERPKPFISIEFYPPKSESGVTSMLQALEDLRVYAPLFCDMTWGAGGSTSDLTLSLCKMITERKVVANMHLTCTNVSTEKLDAALVVARETGIRNLLALRGDPPAGEQAWSASDSKFTCALDLVRYIRASSDDYFNITVAGYPEGHPTQMEVVDDETSLSTTEAARCNRQVDETGKLLTYVCRDSAYAESLAYLKQKVDAGASMIITQMFFEPSLFLTFVADCRNAGITVPILPGIMIITTAGGFKRMAGFCKSRVPDDLALKIQELEKEDEAMCRAFGIDYGVDMCRKLIAGQVEGLHFYCLNSSGSTKAIIERIREDIDIPPLQ
jgi:methylenetetrahydrofolate reductase (NADPH)